MITNHIINVDSMVGQNRCDTCPYWRRLSKDALFGECHKNAPVVLQTDGLLDFAGIFPETDFNSFCAEHPATVAFLGASYVK